MTDIEGSNMTPEEACAIIDRWSPGDYTTALVLETREVARALRKSRDATIAKLAAAIKVVEAAQDLLDEMATTGDIPSAEKQDELLVALEALDHAD